MASACQKLVIKKETMINSLSLFSGYGGIDLALSEYAKPILYCEKDEYAQGILVSRFEDGALPFAPIWNDVTTLDGNKLAGLVDIICGGFPCQDISVAGKGAGLEGKRSGLFYEIVRLAKEVRPTFVFLENVPAIRTRGLEQVIKEFTEMGYDCRWTMLSASSVGAPHRRERWFFLAHSNCELIRQQSRWCRGQKGKGSLLTGGNGEKEFVANTNGKGLEGNREPREPGKRIPEEKIPMSPINNSAHLSDWWSTEPSMGRMANGVAMRSHRIKALGNGVVPAQVKKAFETLMGGKLARTTLKELGEME